MKDARRSFLLETPADPLPAGVAFVRHARFRLHDDYLEKIRRSLETLTEMQVWARLNDDSNSIGNLILHVAGNLRQWVICGVGGAADGRVRSLEFAARESMSGCQLLELLESTVEEADGVLARLTEEIEASQSDLALQRLISPQGYAQTVLDAVFHVVEHFSQHTGQILMLAKWQRGMEIALYDNRELE